MIGSLLLLVLVFGFIFFVARGCVATQESTQVRKYVTSADSLLSDSSNAGDGELQGTLRNAEGDPAKLDEEAIAQVASRSEDFYLQALRQEEVPPEFDDAHHYLITALGLRAEATKNLARATSGDADGFNEELGVAVEDFRTSDSIVANHYFPKVQEGLERAGQTRDQGYLEEPRPFMDYGALGFGAAPSDPGSETARSDPSALHGVEVRAVEVAGQPLYPNGNVVLTGAAEPTFAVTIANGGEAPESAVDVEVVLNTSAERQSKSATIPRIDPKSAITVQLEGFIPGELNETARTTVEAGPVEYEKMTDNNTLSGTVTFGL